MTLRILLILKILLLAASCLRAQQLLPISRANDIAGGVRLVEGLVAYDSAVASTYSTATAQANADAINAAIVACKADHCALMLKAEWYAVADGGADTDGIDIKIENIQGFQLLTTGGLNRWVFPTENSGHGYSNNSTTLVHVGDADITNDVVLEIDNSESVRVGPLTILGARVADDAERNTAMSSGQIAAYGVVIKNTEDDPDGYHTLECSFGLLNCAARVTSSGDDDGGNHTRWRKFFTRYCKKGYQVDTASQAFEHFFDDIRDGNTGITDAYLDFQSAGQLHVLQAFVSPGTFLKIGSGTSSQAQNYLIDDLILDEPSDSATQRLLNVDNSSAGDIRVRLGGRGKTTIANRQQIISKQYGDATNSATRARDIRYQALNGGVECEAYPVRPAAGWEVALNPSRVVSPSATTKLWIDCATKAEADANWTKAVDATSGEERVQAVLDESLASPVQALIQDTAGTRPVANRGDINGRPMLAMRQSAGATTARWLYDDTPTDLDDAVGDLTVMAVIVRQNAGAVEDNYIVSCESTGGTTGWALGLNSSRQPFFKCQNTTATLTTLAIDDTNAWRRYLLIGRRNATSGQITVTCNGQTSSDTIIGPTGILTGVTNRLMLGARWNGSAVNAFRGFIGPVHVEAADIYQVNSADKTGPLIDAAGSTVGSARLNYFRSGWGVW